MMSVYRSKRWEKVRSNELYPGDVVSLTRRSETVPCDLLLLHGQCVVDESMLTGESVPLMKVYVGMFRAKASVCIVDTRGSCLLVQL